MTALPPSDPDPAEPYEVIHIDGEATDVEATLAAHREWVAAGRPGAVSHQEAMAELLDQ